MDTHKKKVKMARKMMMKLERKTSNRIQIPKLPRGTMISRLFTSSNWMKRKMARAGEMVAQVPLPPSIPEGEASVGQRTPEEEAVVTK